MICLRRAQCSLFHTGTGWHWLNKWTTMFGMKWNDKLQTNQRQCCCLLISLFLLRFRFAATSNRCAWWISTNKTLQKISNWFINFNEFNFHIYSRFDHKMLETLTISFRRKTIKSWKIKIRWMDYASSNGRWPLVSIVLLSDAEPKSIARSKERKNANRSWLDLKSKRKHWNW